MNIPQEMLTTLRVRKVYQDLQDPRDLVGNLIFSQRTAVVPADDGEITARYVIRAMMADIVAPNARALTYPIARMRFETYTIPKLKHGRSLDETLINEVRSLEAMGDGVDLGPWMRFEQTLMETLRVDTAMRREALVIGMWIDAFDYDRLGMKMHGITWGMPALLKTNAGIAWTDATNATPITDCLTLLQVAQVEFGMVFTRLTMSMTAFNYMTKTADFINRSKTFVLQYSAGANATALLPFQNNAQMLPLASALLNGIAIEFYDQRAFVENEDGSQAAVPLLPINKVVFSRPDFDNNAAVMDLANARVAETSVAAQPGLGIIGRFRTGNAEDDAGLNDRGPLGYVSGGHNPPEYTFWSVQRCFPRKHRQNATAVMTVGQFADFIPVYEPLAY